MTVNWESVHSKYDTKGVTDLLGCSTMESYMKIFNLDKMFFHEKDVLEVGVGVAVATRNLSGVCKSLDVCDISETALKRCVGFTRNQYLGIENVPAKKYDVVLSSLVIQHLMRPQMVEHVKLLLRSLNDLGKLFVQFSDCKSEFFNPDPIGAGRCLYTLDEMTSCLKENGARDIETRNIWTHQCSDPNGKKIEIIWYGVSANV